MGHGFMDTFFAFVFSSFHLFFRTPFLKEIPVLFCLRGIPSRPLPKTQPQQIAFPLKMVVLRPQKEGVSGWKIAGGGGGTKKRERMHQKKAGLP